MEREAPAEDAREDWADRHVARWRDHWIDVPFDDEVEAIVVRIGRLREYLRGTKRTALEQVDLQDFEYDTLHHLMIRDTPGQASPSALAADLGISGAGMTGRLDTLEKAGWIRRTASAGDRRRVEVEVTESGVAIWRQAMALPGRAENELVDVLPPAERATLAGLLRTLTLATEDDEATGGS